MEDKITDEQIMADIFHKLHRKLKWESNHTPFENIYKRGVPSDSRGRYRKVGEELIRKGFLTSKPTHYGLEVSLNPKKRTEILEIIKNFLNKIL